MQKLMRIWDEHAVFIKFRIKSTNHINLFKVVIVTSKYLMGEVYKGTLTPRGADRCHHPLSPPTPWTREGRGLVIAHGVAPS